MRRDMARSFGSVVPSVGVISPRLEVRRALEANSIALLGLSKLKLPMAAVRRHRGPHSPQPIDRCSPARVSGHFSRRIHGAIWSLRLESRLPKFPQAADWIVQQGASAELPVELIAVPTLLIRGDSDPISPVSVGLHLERRMPNAKLHVVPGGDHLQ
jgi:pimeloyl-ACP methyl ester carboxylesterase